VCVRFFCFYIVSSETASRSNKFNEDLSLDKPLHVIYKVSKLAYRIWVILIANERVKKKLYSWSKIASVPRMTDRGVRVRVLVEEIFFSLPLHPDRF
jgi:hypothetical protein